MTLIINKDGSFEIDSSSKLEIDSKSKILSYDTTVSNNALSKKTKNYSDKEIQEIMEAIKTTIQQMGGDPENPEPKYLKFIAKNADCYWGAIAKFLKEDYSINIVNKIIKAFSSMNLVEGVTDKIETSVQLANKISIEGVNAITVNWFYPEMSEVSLYKETIKRFNSSIVNAQKEYWSKHDEEKGDQLELLDFISALEKSEELSTLFSTQEIKDESGECFKIEPEIYHQILPSYMQRLVKDKSGNDDLVISSFYLVFNWDQFVKLRKIEDALKGKELKSLSKKIIYKPRFNALTLR